MATPERYLGGGKLYFERLVDGTHEAKVEFGEVFGVSISNNTETKEASNHDDATPDIVDEVVMKQDYGLKFETQNLSKNNMILAFRGESSDDTVTTGSALPDGENATADTTVTTIEVETKEKVEGRITFVSSPARGKKRVYTFHKVALKMSGDLALMSEDYIKMPFESKVLKDTSIVSGSKYFKVEEWDI